jgi:UDP-2,3-diacylglucosamine hydrolase
VGVAATATARSGERGEPPRGAGVPAIASERADRLLLAADLHLRGDEEARERLRRLLALARAEGRHLYLLGDVFHTWLGQRHLDRTALRREVEILRGASAVGPPIAIVPGNRDYLLGEDFALATGVRVAGDAIAVECAGLRLHLSHGDLFGLADVRYLRMRRVLRSAPFRGLARILPGPLVGLIAARLRRHSARVVPKKSAATLAPDPGAVRAVLASGFDAVVCGHFHARREERIEVGGAERIFRVLEPFEERGSALSLDAAG